MKIREGFVSNSSSSSFIIVGFDIDELKSEGIDAKKLRTMIKEKYEISDKEASSDSMYELLEFLELDCAYECKYIGKRVVPFPEDNIKEYDITSFVGSISNCHERTKFFCEKLGIHPKIKIIGGIEPS